MLYRWAFRVIKDGMHSDFTSVGLRCAGLKVLLAVITIGRLGDGSLQSLVFGREEVGAMLSLLNETANNDAEGKSSGISCSECCCAVISAEPPNLLEDIKSGTNRNGTRKEQMLRIVPVCKT
jgi:hypothetical protein